VIGRIEARRTALAQLLSRFFDNSPRELMLDLLGHERSDPEEVRQLRQLVAQAESVDPVSPQRKRDRE
jgi:hypothetical protein